MDIQDFAALTIATVALAYVVRSVFLTLDGARGCDSRAVSCARHNDRATSLRRTPLVSLDVSRPSNTAGVLPSETNHSTWLPERRTDRSATDRDKLRATPHSPEPRAGSRRDRR